MMAWFPWVTMPVHRQSESELIDWLRYSAIEFGAPAQFVDSIDDLHSLVGADEEIEELGDKLDSLKDAVNALLEAIEGGDPDVTKPTIEEIRELL